MFTLQKPVSPSIGDHRLELWWDGVKLPVYVQSVIAVTNSVTVSISLDEITFAGPGFEMPAREQTIPVTTTT